MYNQKMGILGIDKKLKFQEMLPKLDFKYNHLSKGYNAFASNGFMFQNNYQYGLKFEMPLLFTAGRAEYRKAKLKIQETQLQQNEKALAINIKIKNYYNDFVTLGNQVILQRNMLANFRRLLNAEETLFMNGESSLFLINSRENKVLETERKLVELKTKYYKTIYTMQWSAGLLGL
jgi:outer membrane protein TolC